MRYQIAEIGILSKWFEWNYMVIDTLVDCSVAMTKSFQYATLVAKLLNTEPTD